MVVLFAFIVVENQFAQNVKESPFVVIIVKNHNAKTVMAALFVFMEKGSHTVKFAGVHNYVNHRGVKRRLEKNTTDIVCLVVFKYAPR